MKTKSVAVNDLNVGDKIVVAPKTVGVVTNIRYGVGLDTRVSVYYSIDGRVASSQLQREVYWHGGCETKVVA